MWTRRSVRREAGSRAGAAVSLWPGVGWQAESLQTSGVTPVHSPGKGLCWSRAGRASGCAVLSCRLG